MTELSSVPTVVLRACDVWLDQHDRRSPELIEGLYMIGSVALGDWKPGSDIDIIAFTSRTPSKDDVALLADAHAAAKVELHGVYIDGPRLLRSDVEHPPVALRRPWTLDGDFHLDSDCFELNPVTWLTLSTNGISLRGPDPEYLNIDLDKEDLLTFVRSNADTYWRSVGDEVGKAAADPERKRFDAEMTAWCVLGVARMLYTAQTGAIESKSGAGRWLAEQLPDHRDLIVHALDIRNRTDVSPPDNRETALAVSDCVRQAVDLVCESVSD